MEVFIVPYDKTMDIDSGFTSQKHYKDIWTKYNNVGKYVDKNIADNNSAMQQIVPYVLLRNESGQYFCAVLNNESNKDKLISMGFGNNLEPIDGVMQPLFMGTMRTLFTDVNLEDLNPLKFIGTVRDMRTDDKHLGYVFLMDNVSNNVKLNNSNLTGQWFTTEELINNYGKLETWSKHIVNFLVDNTF